MNLNNQHLPAKTRALGYTVAVELTDQELIEVAGACPAGQNDSWSTGCGGSCTYADDCKA